MFELFEDLLGFEEVTESTDTLFRAELKHHQKSDSTNKTTSLAYDTFQKETQIPTLYHSDICSMASTAQILFYRCSIIQ